VREDATANTFGGRESLNSPSRSMYLGTVATNRFLQNRTHCNEVTVLTVYL
jgi:hypothetical protein